MGEKRTDAGGAGGAFESELEALRCSCCGWPGSNVIAQPGTPETGFCLYCRERSVPPADDVDLGGGGD